MEEGRSAFKIVTGRIPSYCYLQAVAEVELTGVSPLGAVSHRFNLNLQERDLWEGLGVDGRTILEWTLKR